MSGSALKTERPPFPATRPVLPAVLADKLRRLAWRLRSLAVLRGVGLTLAVAGVLIGAELAADLLFDFPSWLRTAWLVLTTCVSLGLAGWFVIRPLTRRYPGLPLAAVVEAAYPQLGERLSSLVELTHSETPAEWRGSEALLKRLSRETVRAADGLDFNHAVSARRSVITAALGIAAACVLATPLIFSPDNYRLLMARLLVPWGNHDRAGDIYFEIPQGDRVAARGRDLTVTAQARSRRGEPLPREARLQIVSGSGAGDWRLAESNGDDGKFSVTIPRVRGDFDFVFATAEARSKRYHVAVVDPPAIAACTLHVEPPAYTNQPPKTYDGAIGEIAVFERSRLRWEIRCQHDIADGRIVWQPQADDEEEAQNIGLTISDDRRTATAEFTATRGGPFAIDLTDQHGFHNQETTPRSLRIVRDRPPELFVNPQADTATIAPGDPLSVTVRARDDIAVAQLQLELQRPSGETQVFEADKTQLNAAEVEYTFEVDLSSPPLAAGATLTYLLRAADNRPVPGPQWVSTDAQSILVQPDAPSAREKSLARVQERLAQELTEIQNEVRQQQQHVGQLSNNDDAPILRALATQQRQLTQRLERLAEEFAERPVLASLSGDARRIATEQIAVAAAAVAQSIDQAEEEGKRQLKSSAEHLETADEELTELRRRFDRLAALERDLLDLDQMARRAQELSQQLAALERRQAELAAQPDSPERGQQLAELAEQQRQAEAQAAKLAEQLQDLVEKHPEILAAARQAKLRELNTLGRAAEAIAGSQEQLAGTVEQDTAAPAPAPEGEPAEEYLDLIAAQRELAREIVDLTRQAAGILGPQSAFAQQALQTAENAQRAVAAATTGQPATAAESARQAADAAQDLKTDHESLKAKAADIQQRQRELAERFAETAADVSRRRAAERFGQQNLAAQTEELRRQLEQTARDMAAEPLKLHPQDEQTRAAEQATAQARDRMRDASQSLDRNQPDAASQQGHQASQMLNDIAQAIQQAAGGDSGEQSDMPAPAAEDITQALQQMQQARQQMAESQNQPPPNNGQEQPGEGQPAPDGASQTVQQAAESLSQATESLQPGQGRQQQPRQGQGQRSQQTGQAGAPGNAEGGSGSNTPAAELAALQEELERLSGRHWGDLPGTLRTKILESAARRPGGDYAKIIRRYFRELAKTKRRAAAEREPTTNKPAP